MENEDEYEQILLAKWLTSVFICAFVSTGNAILSRMLLLTSRWGGYEAREIFRYVLEGFENGFSSGPARVALSA